MRQVEVAASNAGQRYPSPWGSGTKITCDPCPIGKGRFLNAPSQGSGDFVLGKIWTEGAIGVREPTTDIALETGAARHELWQRDRWCHESTYQLIGI